MKTRNWKGGGGVNQSMKRWAVWAPCCLAAGLLSGAGAGYVTTQRKIEMIQTQAARPASRVTFAEAELNDWVRHEAARLYPGSVREPVLRVSPGLATGTARIDFAGLRRAQGKPPGRILSWLLEGERPVKVTARVQSGGGKATVDVQSVEISGMSIDGPVLDYLLRNYLLANYPAAKVGEPFSLGYRVEKVELRPAAVDVLIGR